MKTGEYYLVKTGVKLPSGLNVPVDDDDRSINGPFPSTQPAVSELRAWAKISDGTVREGDEWAVVRVQKVIRVKSKPVLFTKEEPELEDGPEPTLQPTPRFPSDVSSPAL